MFREVGTVASDLRSAVSACGLISGSVQLVCAEIDFARRDGQFGFSFVCG